MKRGRDDMDHEESSPIPQSEHHPDTHSVFASLSKRARTKEDMEFLPASGAVNLPPSELHAQLDVSTCQRELDKLFNILEADAITRDQSFRLVSEAIKRRQAEQAVWAFMSDQSLFANALWTAHYA